MSNLSVIPCQPQSAKSPTDTTSNTTKLAVLNVRSLAGKSFLINDYIVQHNLDFMFLTETWLSQDNGAAALIESAPPNFSFISEARVNKKGGGVAILFNENFQCRRMSYGNFRSFENAAVQLRGPCHTISLTPKTQCTVFRRVFETSVYYLH